jgi:hypothetical protein
MMRWLLTPIMRPIARRKLKSLYVQQELFNKAIQRARRSKSRVSDLYLEFKRVNAECHKYERWFE